MRRAKLRRREIYLRREVEPARLSGLLLYEHGDVLIKKIHHQHHTADEKPVQHVVDGARHAVKAGDGIYRQRVKDKVHQRRHEQDGKRPVQQRVPLLRGKIYVRDEGQHENKRDLHTDHGLHLSGCILIRIARYRKRENRVQDAAAHYFMGKQRESANFPSKNVDKGGALC